MRSTPVVQYEERYQALPPKKNMRDEKDGVVLAKRSSELSAARTLDSWNKSWHQAWKSEFPASTEKGDALALVPTEESTLAPQVLLISPVQQQGAACLVPEKVNPAPHWSGPGFSFMGRARGLASAAATGGGGAGG